MLDEGLERLRRGTVGRLVLSLECHSCFDWRVPTLDTYRTSHPQVEPDLRVGASFDPLHSPLVLWCSVFDPFR